MLSYLVAMATFGAIYALLSLALNVMWGMTGMVNLGMAGFYALGAYTSALLTVQLGVPVSLGLIAAMLVTAAAGAVTCLTLTHLSDDYFAIVTLGFAEAIRIVADNEIWLTHGSDGISGIPQPFKSALGSDFNLFYLGLCLVLLLLTLLLLERIRVSPFGRVLRAIRDDPQVTAVAGKNVLVFKIKAFALGGVIAGLAGALYGHYTSYIVPQIFEPMLTIYIFLALTAGGRGNNWGAALGAFLVVFLLESSDFATAIIPGIGKVQIAAAREMLIGLLFLVVLRVWPRGILPEPRPRHALLLRASNLSAEPGRQAANFSFLRKL